MGEKDVIFPNKPSRRTAELGARYSPEFACTPFKITLGTFIESLDRGATIIGTGGCQSYCRFGYYWPVQKLILEDLGYKCRFVTFDWENPKEIFKTLRDEFNPNHSNWETLRALRITWIKNRLTDLVDKLLYTYRAVEINRGNAERVANQAYREIVNTHGMRNIQNLHRTLPQKFAREIEIDSHANPLRIVINGEIYVVLEPSLNLSVHQKLNHLGVIVDHPTTLRRFIDVGQKINPFIKMQHIRSEEIAKPYIAHRVGGEAQEAIGEAIWYRNHGWDGLIHLYPFTCMPHITSKNILPTISREYDFPVLSLVVDEQTGEAGFQTRLEAFVDLLKRKRSVKSHIKYRPFTLPGFKVPI